MKKIVALVLSLVMVLGLATTAFGAITLWGNNTETVDCDVFEAAYNTKLNLQTAPVKVTYNPGRALTYELDGTVKTTGIIPHYTMTYSMVMELASTGEMMKAVQAGNAMNAAAGITGGVVVTTDPTGLIATVVPSADAVYATYVRVYSIPADANAADYVLVKAHNPAAEQGKAQVFAQTAADAYVILKKVANVEYVVEATEFTDWSTACEAYARPALAPATAKFYTIANKVVELGAAADVKYLADKDGDMPALVGDEVVVLDSSATVKATKHAWIASAWDAKKVVTEYTCNNCKTVGTVINSPLNAPAGAKIDKLIDGTLVAYNMAVVEAPAAGDKVESAQTFDAGIAMYVGMSVMAAAGSAVVLKKKD